VKRLGAAATYPLAGEPAGDLLDVSIRTEDFLGHDDGGAATFHPLRSREIAFDGSAGDRSVEGIALHGALGAR
jgi:hypothetical protein